jgi:hypothetical protein
MDRPRFQINIGTISLAVVVSAVVLALAKFRGPGIGLALFYGPAWVIFIRSKPRAGRRAENGRRRIAGPRDGEPAI